MIIMRICGISDFLPFFLIQFVQRPTQLTMPLSPNLLVVIVLLHFLKWKEAIEWLRIQADTLVFIASSAMYLLYQLEYGL